MNLMKLGIAERASTTLAATLFAGLLIFVPNSSFAQATTLDQDAVVTWGAPIVSAAPSTGNRINNQTLREIVRISVGGTKVRIKLSNRWNPLPLEVGGAQVAVRSSAENIDASSSRALTFSGSATFTIPPGAELLSDWVTLTVPDAADLAVDLYLPGDTSATGTVLSVRNGAQQTNYVSSAGNFVGSTTFPTASTRTIWNFLASVDVVSPGKTGGIVAFGDSITEGLASTANTNSRWPDVLARRLLQANMRIGVANEGISGNRVAQGGGSTNPSALSRMDRDVIVQTGATHVIVLLGINDANGGTSGEDVIAALQQTVIRARTQQLKIYVGTVTPYGNGSDAVEARRQLINQWIRTTREIDGYIDFDVAVRDPSNPRRMLASLNSGDQLHPNNAGYEAMGNAIDLALFR
jgi:lysophospholipase L1-like esterase